MVEAQSDYIEKHVIISGVKARPVLKNQYVVEITLKDYQKTSKLPKGFGYSNKIFGDDGTGNDLIPGDGVYTSKEISTFSSTNRSNLDRNTIYYDPNFMHKAELNNERVLQPKIKISCKFGKIGCPPPTGTCTACVQLGWQCWGLTECKVGLEW